MKLRRYYVVGFCARVVVHEKSMKKLLILLTAITFSAPASGEIKYKTYDRLPCSFNGARITSTANPASKAKKGPCADAGKGYSGKQGSSIHVSRGTPIFAVKDMELMSATDYSAQYTCTMENLSQTAQDFNKRVKHPDTGEKMKCKAPWDGMRMTFKTVDGEMVLYYHMMSETPLVPGFGKDKCAIRMFYKVYYSGQRLNGQVTAHTCGGIKKKFVKKGEHIGYVGSTGGNKGNHVSFNINPIGKGYLQHPEHKKHGLKWENYPKDSTRFLLPIMSKKYLKEVGIIKK